MTQGASFYEFAIYAFSTAQAFFRHLSINGEEKPWADTIRSLVSEFFGQYPL